MVREAILNIELCFNILSTNVCLLETSHFKGSGIPELENPVKKPSYGL